MTGSKRPIKGARGPSGASSSAKGQAGGGKKPKNQPFAPASSQLNIRQFLNKPALAKQGQNQAAAGDGGPGQAAANGAAISSAAGDAAASGRDTMQPGAKDVELPGRINGTSTELCAGPSTGLSDAGPLVPSSACEPGAASIHQNPGQVLPAASPSAGRSSRARSAVQRPAAQSTKQSAAEPCTTIAGRPVPAGATDVDPACSGQGAIAQQRTASCSALPASANEQGRRKSVRGQRKQSAATSAAAVQVEALPAVENIAPNALEGRVHGRQEAPVQGAPKTTTEAGLPDSRAQAKRGRPCKPKRAVGSRGEPDAVLAPLTWQPDAPAGIQQAQQDKPAKGPAAAEIPMAEAVVEPKPDAPGAPPSAQAIKASKKGAKGKKAKAAAQSDATAQVSAANGDIAVASTAVVASEAAKPASVSGKKAAAGEPESSTAVGVKAANSDLADPTAACDAGSALAAAKAGKSSKEKAAAGSKAAVNTDAAAAGADAPSFDAAAAALDASVAPEAVKASKSSKKRAAAGSKAAAGAAQAGAPSPVAHEAKPSDPVQSTDPEQRPTALQPSAGGPKALAPDSAGDGAAASAPSSLILAKQPLIRPKDLPHIKYKE